MLDGDGRGGLGKPQTTRYARVRSAPHPCGGGPALLALLECGMQPVFVKRAKELQKPPRRRLGAKEGSGGLPSRRRSPSRLSFAYEPKSLIKQGLVYILETRLSRREKGETRG